MLVGCNKDQKPSEKAFDYMEKAASQEQDFNEQQQPLVDEEKKEQDLYNKIMKLDMDDYKQISDYSDQALASIQKRQDMIDKEKKSIDSGYKMFKKAIPHLNDVEKDEAQKSAQAIVDIMDKRYEAFQSLYDAYQSSIDEDTKLFNLLKKKELTTEELQTQLKVVNDSYTKVDEDKETFNKYTEEFNKNKKDFYDTVGITGSKEDKK